jgi:conjugal transfer pilus assembly protein TraV
VAQSPSLALPLRSSARILRLWFKPWEDADRDLYDQGYVYVQIDAGQWLIDHAQRQIRDAYAPIRPPMGAPVKPATPEPSTSPGRPVGQQRLPPYTPDNSESPDTGPLLPPTDNLAPSN